MYAKRAYVLIKVDRTFFLHTNCLLEVILMRDHLCRVYENATLAALSV